MKKTGDDYFDSEDFRDMLQEYEQAVNTGQPVLMDADELAEIADFYQLDGQLDEAENAITLALSLSSGAIAPLTYRIHEALYNGDVEAAKRYLAQIVEKGEPDYVYDTAEIMLAEGKVDEADQYLRDTFKTIAPDEYQDYVVDVASLYQDCGFSDKAMEWMSRAKPEDSADFKELMARTLFGLGKYKDSERLFSELIDTDPFQKRYWNALASAQFMSEDYSNSIQSSEYAIAIDPDDTEGLLSKANGLYQLNNYKDALEYFRRYSEKEPDDEFSYMYQGTCLLNMNQNEEAIKVLEQAENVAPEDSPYLPDIYQELCFAYSELGDVDKGLDYLNKTDTLDCDHIGLMVVKGHVLLGAGRVEEAEKMYRQAIRESENAIPDEEHPGLSSSKTLMRVIVSLYDNKYVEAAYKMFLKYFKLVERDYDEGYAYMALCCYELEKYDEFLKYLKEACKRNPQECKLALSHLFPSEVKPDQYYEYIKNKMKNR